MCKWFYFHKWKDIKKIENGIFMGEKYTRHILTEYRICSKCGLIQGFAYDSQGGFWLNEVPEFQEIIRNKLQFIDNYFLIKDEQ